MMATHTLTRFYNDRSEAVAAVQALEAAGFGHDHVSIVAHDGVQTSPASLETGHSVVPADDVVTGTAAGAAVGTVIGGGVGLLTGMGAIIIPGFGPVVAAGWLVTTLTGAGVGAAVGVGTGGLVGALICAGVSQADAEIYAEGIRRGGAVVTARADENRSAEAAQIFDRSGAVDPLQHSALHAGLNRLDT